MGKFTREETALTKNMLATLSIRRNQPEKFMKEVYEKTNTTISRGSLSYVWHEETKSLNC